MFGGLIKVIKLVCLSFYSGDVCIMYGDCRLVYYVVFRILLVDKDNFKYCYNFNGDLFCCGNKISEENDFKFLDVLEGLVVRR